MKVYVDELPKSCKECPFSATTYYWKENNLEKTLFKISCKLGCSNECCFNSLSDYTKQVRKEVVEEIKSAIKEKLTYPDNRVDCPFDNGYPDEGTICSVLDQIQGD